MTDKFGTKTFDVELMHELANGDHGRRVLVLCSEVDDVMKFDRAALEAQSSLGGSYDGHEFTFKKTTIIARRSRLQVGGNFDFIVNIGATFPDSLTAQEQRLNAGGRIICTDMRHYPFTGVNPRVWSGSLHEVIIRLEVRRDELIKQADRCHASGDDHDARLVREESRKWESAAVCVGVLMAEQK